MSEGRKNKKGGGKKESKRTVILSKREGTSKDEKSSKKTQVEEKIQPKILLKVKEREPTPSATPIVIATRESHDPPSSQSPSTISIQSKEREAGPSPVNITIEQPVQPIPQMSRSVPLISSALYQVNQNAAKFFMKTNTDFFVVSVIGTQGVGKSTILNLLTSDDNRDDIFNHYFKEKEGIFPVKPKNGSLSSCPRTESIQMFITKDRMILLDCPPVLCNSYRKDATLNELDDIKLLIFILTASHLVIVVQDDYFNLNLIRLLQFAELAKPNPDNKCFIADYFPNMLFVRNNGKRIDFLAEEKVKKQAILRHFFKRSHLKIYVGQWDKQKKGRQEGGERCVNYFVFPEVKSDALNAYHPSLELVIADLRNRVYMSPRNQMYNGNTELTEGLWFELISSTASNKRNFFLSAYEDIRRSHNHTGAESGSKGSMGYGDVD
ncbi:unnamed protein product [Hermetia illucens]|uniref:Protein SMG9 n=1 Tax=Hermetia illucens TaxID=343691 RepID=A0A7R8UVG4_HERIL|nr:protein SMG9 isoform X2 [Hermetia illucens]CAD7087265.1 unnamed protein product [Hermetia illucens]